MDKLSDYDREIAHLNDELLRLTVELEKQEGETKVVRERVNFTRKENDRLNLDMTNANMFVDAACEQEQKKIDEKVALKGKLEALNKSYEELSDKHLKIVDEMSMSESEAGQSQQKMIEALGSLSDIKSNVSRLEAERSLLVQNRENLHKNLEEVGAKLDNAKKLFEESAKSIQATKDEFSKVK